jgi:hypothetical protein
MDALIRRVSAWDGVPLNGREWRGGHCLPPLSEPPLVAASQLFLERVA